MKPLELHPDASEEGEGAIAWYAERDPRVAERLAVELSAAFDRITEAPDRWPAYLHGTRRPRLRSFPFLVVYREESTRIVVVAIVHTKQKPGYWKSR